jgi:putative transposase
MQTIKGYTSRALNRDIGRKGRLWQPGFYDRIVRGWPHLLEVIEYIHANPVKAGLVDDPSDYEYSSAHRGVLTDLEAVASGG